MLGVMPRKLRKYVWKVFLIQYRPGGRGTPTRKMFSDASSVGHAGSVAKGGVGVVGGRVKAVLAGGGEWRRNPPYANEHQSANPVATSWMPLDLVMLALPTNIN